MAYRPRILVVEDEPLSQDMLVRRMASRGFRVATVADGAAAIAHVTREVPDLLLLDINMPGLSGLEVLRELRKTYTRDQLPVILVTAMADSEDVIRGLDAGANDYVVKPINFAVLLARVQVHLRIKLDVSLLIEAERQRVLIAALGEACHQLAQPMTAVMMTLEALIRHPSDDAKETPKACRTCCGGPRKSGRSSTRCRTSRRFGRCRTPNGWNCSTTPRNRRPRRDRRPRCSRHSRGAHRPKRAGVC